MKKKVELGMSWSPLPFVEERIEYESQFDKVKCKNSSKDCMRD
jgi:hypothetical protein